MRTRAKTATREVWMYVKDPNKLRRRRKDKGLTQVQLAALCSPCTQQYISLLESGRDRDCSERIAEKLCRWLDIDMEDYFEERAVLRMPEVATASRVAGKSA